MPYPSLLTTSTADLKLTWSTDPVDGRTVVDFVLGPDGNLMMVSGINRLVQDVIRWMLSPQGSNPLDPTFGNPLFTLIGRPGNLSTATFEAMVQQCQDEFMMRQQSASAQGYLSLDEQVKAFSDTQVIIGNGTGGVPIGVVQVNFIVHSRAGTSQSTLVNFNLNQGL